MSSIYVVSAGDGYYPKSGNGDWQAVYNNFTDAMAHSRYKSRPDYYDDDDDYEPCLWDWFSIVAIDLETLEHTEALYEGRYTRRVGKAAPFTSEKYRGRRVYGGSVIEI